MLMLDETEGSDAGNYVKVKCRSCDTSGWVVKSAVVFIIPDPDEKPTIADCNDAGSQGTSKIPAGYYDAAGSLSGDALKESLHRIIRNHKAFSYTDVYDILERTDGDPCDSARIVLLYTGWKIPRDHKDHGGNYDYEAAGYIYRDAWNREHVWPKSHGFPDENDTAYTDLHHIRPADRSINTERNTRAYDYATIPYADDDGTVPTLCKTDTRWIWEPPDFVKGDIARMLFYMDVRYEGYAVGNMQTSGLELVDEEIPKTSRMPVFGRLSTLLEWHLLDPVDNWERRRNDIIYNEFQGNRNPFIDHPEYAGLIWGDGQ